MQADALALGIDLGQLLGPDEPEPEPEVCEVWPEHWQALELFLDARDQFELGVGMGGAVWQPVRNVNLAQAMVWLGVADAAAQAELRGRYRVIEAEALRLANAAK